MKGGLRPADCGMQVAGEELVGNIMGEYGYVGLLRRTRDCAGECGISSGSSSFPVVTSILCPASSLSEQQFGDCGTTVSNCNVVIANLVSLSEQQFVD